MNPILNKIKAQISKFNIPTFENYLENCHDFDPLDCYKALEKFSKVLTDKEEQKQLNNFMKILNPDPNHIDKETIIIAETKKFILTKLEKIIYPISALQEKEEIVGKKFDFLKSLSLDNQSIEDKKHFIRSNDEELLKDNDIKKKT